MHNLDVYCSNNVGPFYLINLVQLTIMIRLIGKWNFNTTLSSHVSLLLLVILKRCRSEVDSGLQREVMSSTINGGDVDCICVWLHKIYSSELLLLSGASKCIQTINYSLLLLLSLSALPKQQPPQEEFSWVALMFLKEKKMCTCIMEVWDGPLNLLDCLYINWRKKKSCSVFLNFN